MQRNRRAFTLIEVVIAVFICLLILGMGVPSLRGVLAERRLHRSLDAMNKLVRQAQETSIRERRAYLISWEKKGIVLRPEAHVKGEEADPVAILPAEKGDSFTLQLPSALTEDPPPEWAFWPSGICEPAVVKYKGVDGSWTARYSALTGRAELQSYVAR